MKRIAPKAPKVDINDNENEQTLKKLVCVTSGINENDLALASLMRNAIKTLRGAGLDRVNQFAVRDRLNGLDERWRVSFEDDVADALCGNLHKLKVVEAECNYKYVPECLQLLLSMSDGRPAASFSESLDAARAARAVPSITWKEIVQDDSTTEEGLWDDIDYAQSNDDSSDGSQGTSHQIKTSFSTQRPSSEAVDSEEHFPGASMESEEDASEQLGCVKTTRKSLRQEDPKACPVTESMIVRETIHMLAGLSTDVYNHSRDGTIQHKTSFQLFDLSAEALSNVLHDFSNIGSDVEKARAFVDHQEEKPVLQRFQELVQGSISEFYTVLSNAEKDAMDGYSAAMTLIRLLGIVTIAIKPIKRIMSILPNRRDSRKRDIEFLNNLMSAISEDESTGLVRNTEISEKFIECFDICFRVYWRPIEDWFAGVNPDCREIDFIERTRSSTISTDSFWSRLYSMEKTHAPVFLRPYLAQIFTTGKTAAFLFKLRGGLPDEEQIEHAFCQDESTSIASGSLIFEPVQKRFERIMEIICLRKTRCLGTRLREELLEKWQLNEVLSSLQIVYLAEQGSVNDKAYTALFQLLDQGSRWRDRFLLTDIFQQAFENVPSVTANKVTVSVDFDARTEHARERSLVKLESIRINYSVPLPLANLIDGPSLSVYQRIAKLLLQIARAKYCLDRQIFDRLLCGEANGMQAGILFTSLHHRLRWFITTLHSFFAIDVVPGATTSLKRSVAASEDFDAMIRHFRISVTMLQRGCFLSAPLSSTHQAIVSLLDLAVVLSDMRSPLATLPNGEEDLSSDDERTRAAEKAHVRAISKADDAKLWELHNTFKQLLAFVQSGVKEAARSTGDSRLYLFAEDITIELATVR